MTLPTIPLAERDQVEHLLARQFYLHFCKHRDSKPNRAPHVPAWAQAYAEIALRYTGYDDETIAALSRDYK